MFTRRGFLGSIIAAAAAPAIVKAEIIMPVKKIITPTRAYPFMFSDITISVDDWVERNNEAWLEAQRGGVAVMKRYFGIDRGSGDSSIVVAQELIGHDRFVSHAFRRHAVSRPIDGYYIVPARLRNF